MSKKEKTIDPKRFYTLGEIVREGIIPGIDSIPKAARLMRNDLIFRKILNAQIVASPMQAISYKVKGSNIINYLIVIDDQKNG